LSNKVTLSTISHLLLQFLSKKNITNICHRLVKGKTIFDTDPTHTKQRKSAGEIFSYLLSGLPQNEAKKMGYITLGFIPQYKTQTFNICLLKNYIFIIVIIIIIIIIILYRIEDKYIQ